MAAKDAVRELLRRRGVRECFPADIEIESHMNEPTVATGRWSGDPSRSFRLAFLHGGGFAVAVAADASRVGSLGVDILPVEGTRSADQRAGGQPREATLLKDLPEATRSEWTARFACARQAACKALVNGSASRPEDFIVSDYDENTGRIRLEPPTGRKSAAGGRPLSVFTHREGGYVFAHVAWKGVEPEMETPTKEKIFQDLLGILDQLSEDWEYSGEVTPETRMLSELELESIDMVVLGEFIEEHYGRTFPFVQYLTELGQSDQPDIAISDLVDFIHAHLSGQEPS